MGQLTTVLLFIELKKKYKKFGPKRVTNLSQSREFYTNAVSDVGDIWKVCNRLVPLRRRRKKTIYRSLIKSHLRFATTIFGAANPKLLDPISILQTKAVRHG